MSQQKRVFALIVGSAVLIVGLTVGFYGVVVSLRKPPDLAATATVVAIRATAAAVESTEVAVAATRAALSQPQIPTPTDTPEPAPTSTLIPQSTITPVSQPDGSLLAENETWDGLRIEVLSINNDAWPLVQAHNQFNDPPHPGRRMMMITLRITNVQDDPQTPVKIDESDFKVIGSRKEAYTTYGDETNCGVVSDAIDGTLFPGDSMSGNICVQVPRDETGFVLIYDRYTGGAPPTYISLSK